MSGVMLRKSLGSTDLGTGIHINQCDSKPEVIYPYHIPTRERTLHKKHEMFNTKTRKCLISNFTDINPDLQICMHKLKMKCKNSPTDCNKKCS